MNKEAFIAQYGEGAYMKMLARSNAWNKAHPEIMLMRDREQHRKGSKYYAKKLLYNRTGLRGERKRVRSMHASKWRKYKSIIAPGSQIHHEWIPETAKYRGVALVEKDQHMHGFIDVIKIFEGEIHMLTENEIALGNKC